MSHHSRLPCKRYKCLKYPSCFTKKVIDCDILREYYEALMEDNIGLANRVSNTWGNIRLVLPNLLTIQGPIETKYGTATKTTIGVLQT